MQRSLKLSFLLSLLVSSAAFAQSQAPAQEAAAKAPPAKSQVAQSTRGGASAGAAGQTAPTVPVPGIAAIAPSVGITAGFVAVGNSIKSDAPPQH